MINRRTTTGVRRTRLGFTLVEMMVVMAILLGIMLILAEAFRISLDFVRTANSTSSMILQLNGAGNALQRDLSADHFFYEDGLPNGGVKLSDRRFNLGGTMPKGGFFKIVNSAPTAQIPDSDSIAVNVATGHLLHFTSILPGGTDASQFSALSPVSPPPGTPPYSARAAEIAYFLVPTGTKTSNTPTGQPLFNLIRRYRLVALTNDDVPLLNLAVPTDSTYPDVISTTNGTSANTLATITAPANRLSLASFPAGSTRFGEDILASNVLSFEVLAQWDGATPSRPFSIGGNTDGPHDFFQGAVPTTFDTALSPAIRVRSLQITLRVYDPRMKQARQNTWKFAM